MADEKIFQSRIQLKHDTEENWLKATNFIPKEGEIIIYDVDANNPTSRFKVGNGTTVVNLLPFVAAQADWNITDENDSGYIKNKPDYDKIAADVEELSANVAYISETDNENIENPDIEIESITVDSALSISSTNPVQNRVITQEINQLKFTTQTMTGATADADGTSGLVPAPLAGDEGKVLFGSGTWGSLSGTAKPWQRIRRLTVPSDVTADTSGATWSTSADGVLGAEFDTDDNGDAFEVSEFVLYLMGNWVSVGNLILRANDNKMLVNLKENLGTDTQFGFYWLRKLGKTWCTESTVGPQNRFRYENLPVYRSGFQTQATYPFESITKIKVECSVAFAGSGAVIEVWGR